MDFQQILDDLVGALKGELGDGFGAIEGFVRDQGRRLAKQAETIAKMRADGPLTDDDERFQFFLDSLQTNSENFARSVVMLSILTIEKAWNAVAGVLWGAMRGILSGAGVPDNLLPDTPPLSL